jgi:hypothetical protein
MQPRYWNVQDERGNAVPGAQVTIRKTLDQSIASIFDPVSGAALSNPFTVTDQGGEFGWTAGDGKYDEITVTRPGVPADTKKGVLLFDPFTDGGSTGFWPDITASAKILRLRDRVFVGAAAAATGNRSGSQGSILPDGTAGAAWALRDSQFLSIAQQGLIAISGIARSSDLNDAPTETIGVAGFVVNDKAGASAWGLYSDIQHESGAGGSRGLEVAAKNKGADFTATPYGMASGVFGLWLAGGGDPTYGGAPANPSNTAIAIIKNGHTWNRGIVFGADSLTGTDGLTGTANAIVMAKGHRVRWLQSGGLNGAEIRSDVGTTPGREVSLLFQDRFVGLFGEAGINLFQFSVQASAVNYMQFQNAPTGQRVAFNAKGTDTNVGIKLANQGTALLELAGQTTGTTVGASGAASALPANPLGYLSAVLNGATVRVPYYN